MDKLKKCQTKIRTQPRKDYEVLVFIIKMCMVTHTPTIAKSA